MSDQAVISAKAAIRMLEQAVENITEHLADESVTLHYLGGVFTTEMLMALSVVHGGDIDGIPSLEAQLADGINDGINLYSEKYSISILPEDCYSSGLH